MGHKEAEALFYHFGQIIGNEREMKCGAGVEEQYFKVFYTGLGSQKSSKGSLWASKGQKRAKL